MLTEEMLIADAIRCRLHLRIDQFGTGCHLGNFFQHNRIVYCLCRILAPCKRSMICTEHARCINWIDATSLKCLDNDFTGIRLISLINLFRCQTTCTRNRSKQKIRMCSSVKRNISSGLCPRSCLRRMCMYHTSDVRILLVQFQMGRCIGRWFIVTLDLVSLKVHNNHIFRLQLIVIHAAWLNNEITALTVNPADIAPCIGNPATAPNLAS